MKIKIAFLIAMLSLAISSHAAEFTINGTVLEKGTRNPIRGALVLLAWSRRIPA